MGKILGSAVAAEVLSKGRPPNRCLFSTVIHNVLPRLCVREIARGDRAEQLQAGCPTRTPNGCNACCGRSAARKGCGWFCAQLNGPHTRACRPHGWVAPARLRDRAREGLREDVDGGVPMAAADSDISKAIEAVLPKARWAKQLGRTFRSDDQRLVDCCLMRLVSSDT